ncbi:LamG domain-containing protein [Candidatus Poribacteria bacterium]|nr:LamG domain-containing protein [Candidatus Poribacteria bacterium]
MRQVSHDSHTVGTRRHGSRRELGRLVLGLVAALGVLCSAATPALANNALVLDGVDDYVTIVGDPAILKQTGAITVEAWFKHPNAAVAPPAVIASKAGAGGPSWVLDLTETGTLEFIAFGGAGTTPSFATTTQLLNDGQWHHAAAVWNESGARLYIDGTLDGEDTSGTSGPPLFDTTDPVVVGADATLAAGPTLFTGEIDEVRIWNIARSNGEISATMNTTLVGTETNLVGYWNFDDGTANDVTPNGSHGTVGGGAAIAASDTPVSGGGGGAAGDNSILLDGVDDYVIMAGDPAALKLTGAMTIEAWFKHPAVDVAWPAVIASKAGPGGASWVLDLSSVDGNLEFIAFGGNGASPSGALTAQNLNDGLWHHAAGVWDGSEPRLYIDGALAATGPTTTGPLFDTTASVAIGNDAALAAATAFAGEIDEVRIWDVARSQVDIQTDMNTTLVGDETNLVGYWNFDDGTGNDVTLNGSHGTVGGGAVIAASDTPLSGGGGAAGANSVLLDGVDDHVIMAGDPAALKLTGPMTVEAWFKHPTGAVASPAVIASKAAPENVSWVMDLWDTDGRLEFGAFGDGVAPSFAQSVQTVNDGLWHHAAGVWDGFEARLYIDGVLDGVGTTEAAPLTDSTSEVVIGNDAALAAAAAFLGEIDEVRMWDVARSQVDIQNDMNATLVGNETNLVGYWNFDAGTADDLVGASHGTLGGGATLVTSEAPLSGGAAPAVQALALDGVDDYVDVADIADYDLNITSGSGLTVETWFRTSAASLPDNALVFKWDSSDASYALHWGGHARSAVRHTGRRHPTDRGLIPAIQRWVLAPRGRSMAGRHGDALRGRHRCWV